MAQSRDVYRRRRLAALGAVAAAAALAGAAVGAGGGGKEPGAATGTTADVAAKQAPPKAPAELPLGGRRIFPHYRVVAYYGAPQSHALGALGIGSPDAPGARLLQRAAPHARDNPPGWSPLALLVAGAHSGPGGG